ncbi:MAG TPA: SMC family ATPase [Thermoplasmata archaeon]|nr:SMC family ATPase [Thermoplasmata archaeon]
MEIRSIRVRNIRSFEEATLRLRGGTTLLWGDVGAGKTSLLHAIEMALFGFSEVDPAHLIRHRASTAEVALTLSDGEHEYTFTRRFHRRLRKGKDLYETDEKGTGLSKDGTMTRYPATELRQRAIDLLGFPDNPNPRAHSDLWRWAVYVPQERMRQILEGDDADARLETVRKALGLEKYRAAAENAKLVALSLRREADHESEQADLLAHWEADLLEAEEALRTAERVRSEAERSEHEGRRRTSETTEQLADAQVRARRLEADRRELGEVDARIREIESADQVRTERMASASAREHALGAEIERLGTSSGTLDTRRAHATVTEQGVADWTHRVELAQAGVRELEVAEARLRDSTNRLSEDEHSLARATEVQARAVERRDALEAEAPRSRPADRPARALPEIDRALAQSVEAYESSVGRVQRLEIDLQETEELIQRGICPRCGQSVSSQTFPAHRAEVTEQLGRVREAHRLLAEQREALVGERSHREASDRDWLAWEAIEKRRELTRSEADRAREDLRRGTEAIEARRREQGEARQIVERFAPARRDLEHAQVELRAATREHDRSVELVNEAIRARAEFGIRTESLEALRREQAASRADAASDDLRRRALVGRRAEITAALEGEVGLEKEIRDLEQTLGAERTSLEASVGRLHRAEGDAEAARRRIAQARTRVAERERLQEASRGTRATAAFLTGPFRDAMLELEHRLLARAKVEFDRGFGRYFSALIDDPSLVARSDPRFNPSVEIDGELTPPEALSGGERTALALAFRLALGEVVRSLDRLNLSTLILDEPTDGFSPEQVQRMGELLSELAIPQVILVSHEAALNGVADRVVRVRKVAGASELEGDDVTRGARTLEVGSEQ